MESSIATSSPRLPLERHFDKNAPTYDSVYEGRRLSSRFWQRAVRGALFAYYRKVLAYLGDCKGLSILDVGCGPGKYLEALALGGANVTGLDLSMRMLEAAARRLERAGCSNYRLIKTDLFNFSAEEPFNVVLAIGVFDYSSAPVEMMSRLKMLSQGPIIASFRNKSLRAKLRGMHHRAFGISLRSFGRDDIVTLCQSCNLCVEELWFVARSGGGWLLVARPS